MSIRIIFCFRDDSHKGNNLKSRRGIYNEIKEGVALIGQLAYKNHQLKKKMKEILRKSKKKKITLENKTGRHGNGEVAPKS